MKSKIDIPKPKKIKIVSIKIVALFLFPFILSAQSILPPVIEWHGKSEMLIANTSNPWITPTEQSGFVTTPTYDETMNWFKKVADASPLLSMVSIGKSVEGRAVFMIVATSGKKSTATALKQSEKPTILVQAGIHAGEIDGKDAGMMLLRDIAFGTKKHLLDKVNLLFIPILNVDGHERNSSFNRPNQRGPENMGWRTNAQNLNLNRDYAKIDTNEIRAVIKVMNDYNPMLFMDIHVTDGADYQYDITFGGHGLQQGYSKSISNWLETKYKPYADNYLSANGHIPGQLLFAVNDRDFSKGNALTLGEPRFSDAYGNLRHMASILVENHSLKPFKQRVLGTYILLESTMQFVGEEAQSLTVSTLSDRAKRETKIPMKFQVPQTTAPDSLKLLGIESKLVPSTVTNGDYVVWTGKPVTATIANYKGTEALEFVTRPKGYWIPVSSADIIERLQLHGIQMEIIQQPREVTVEMYRIQEAKFQNEQGTVMPFEGHVQVTGTPKTEVRKQLFATGSAYVTTDQPLGDLAMLLLEPKSPDSYFSWGFFPQVFQRTEYIEGYVLEPTMRKMLDESPELQAAFEQKKLENKDFATNANAIYTWFYSKTKYYDQRYLLYPIGREISE